jgi:hypothetical protein
MRPALLVSVVAMSGLFLSGSAGGAEHAHHGSHPGKDAHSAHMRLSSARQTTPDDRARAERLLRDLRRTLTRYQDYRVAVADGYKPFLPNVPLNEYHFTNYRNAFLEAFRFDPDRPSSLLYRKNSRGYQLVGVMFTAPRHASEEKLDERVPLSVARWHAHINLCLPKRGEARRADWTRFGPRGSITTAEDCAEAKGRFVPQLFGWMVHVYPFETNPEKIWQHPMEHDE